MKRFFLLFFASSGFAILPPLAQSAQEIQALLIDPQLYEKLGSAAFIQEIIRNEKGYLIVTQNYSMQVDIQYMRREQPFCGPALFQFEFYEPVNRGARRG